MTVAEHVDRRKSSPAHRAAYAEALAAPAEHKPRLVTAATVRPQIHGAGVVGLFNSRLAVMITRSVGTMWTAYLFALMLLISLPAAIATHSSLVIVAWVVQTFLQVGLLPIINKSVERR